MESINLVLMGRTGNGKSATANSIVGNNAFPSGWSFAAAASRRSFKYLAEECKSVQRKWKDGRTINVIDTPGLFDTSATKEFIDKEIVKCINLVKNGLHGLILVYSIKNQFTEEDANIFERMEMLFGPRIVNYMVVVFTGGDQLEIDGVTFEEYLNECPQNLKEILHRCNSRMVLFNNKGTPEIKEQQVANLLEQVDSIVVENESQPYSNELFAKAQTLASQFFYIRDRENYFAELVKQLNVLTEQNMWEIKKKLREQLASAYAAKEHAENEALSVKQNLEEEIRKLRGKLQDKMVSADSAPKHAENEAPSIKQKSDEEISKLQEQSEEQLASADSVQKYDENEARSIKQKLDEEIYKLQEKLQDQQKHAENEARLVKQKSDEEICNLQKQLKEQLDYAKSAQRDAENEALLIKKKSDEKISKLQEQLDYAESARKDAENETLLIKNKTYEEICKLREQLDSAESAREHAENEARSIKENLDEEIHKLRKQLQEQLASTDAAESAQKDAESVKQESGEEISNLQEKLASVVSAMKHAENEALSVKLTYEEELKTLREQLKQAKDSLESTGNPKHEDPGRCSIL